MSLEPLAFGILHLEKANKIFGKRLTRLLENFITARPPLKSDVAAYRRLRRRLLRSIHDTVVTPSAPLVIAAASPSANAQYVCRDLLLPLIIFSEVMILLHLAISMIELFMLDLVMFMIYLFCNLIIQLPNYSTCSSEDHMQRGVNSCLVKNYIISTKTYHPANCTGAIVVIA